MPHWSKTPDMPDIGGQRAEDSGHGSCGGDAAPVQLPPQSEDNTLSSVTLLAFDFGAKRIGVAVGNALLCSAKPLTTISEEKTDLRFAKIAVLLNEWQPEALIVGLPSNDDGSPHELTALCRRFANRLKGRFNLPVILVDERYTSLAASAQLNAEGVYGRKQKTLIDQYAAQQILQAYFEEPSAGVTV